MAMARKVRDERRYRLGLIIPILTACGILGMGSAVRADSVSTETWTQVDQTQLDFLFVRAGVEFGGFEKIMIDPLSVWHPGGQSHEGHITRLRRLFESSFAHKLEDAGFVIVDRPGASVLRLHVEVIDLKLSEADDFRLDERFLFDVSPGKITLVAELLDSLSNEVLLRIADKEKSAPADAQAQGPWEQADRAFHNWSAQFGGVMLGMTGPSRQDSALMAQRITE